MSVSIIGFFSPSSLRRDGKTVAVCTFIVSCVSVAATIVPFSESVTALPAAPRTGSASPCSGSGNGLVAPPSFGWTSKWRCGVPSASPESPTKPIAWPATTFAPSFRPGQYDPPATHLPLLSFAIVTSLFRWM